MTLGPCIESTLVKKKKICKSKRKCKFSSKNVYLSKQNLWKFKSNQQAESVVKIGVSLKWGWIFICNIAAEQITAQHKKKKLSIEIISKFYWFA